jgi:hypothetical protein
MITGTTRVTVTWIWGHEICRVFLEDAGTPTLHIASAGLKVRRSLPGTVSMLVSIFPDMARSFAYRPPVRSSTILRVRADRVDHAL